MISRDTNRQLAVWVLLAFALLAPRAALAEGKARSLTVTSYNIHHGVGIDDNLNLERIASLLSETGAEVIGLQEVDNHWSNRSDFADQAKMLAERLGMFYVYGANLDRDPANEGEPRRQYGTAILSAYPIVDWENTPLPNLGGEQRGLLEATLRVRGVPVRVLNTHLQHDNAEERQAQAEAIAERVDAIREPVVLVGDLNARPGAQELSALEARLDDTWRLAGEGPGYTYPAEAPDRRIDYVLVGRCMTASEVHTASSPASDHLPLTAEVRLPHPGLFKRHRCRADALANAHAHNDYEHTRPLQDALDHGFTSVEADVWLVDGELLVAHDFDELDPARTFESLYLAPLEARVRENRGRVYARWPHSLQLLIDIKSEGEATYLAIHEALAAYRRMFTTFVDGRAYESAVTAVISGNRPREVMMSQTIRYAGYDGRLSDLGQGDAASFMPLISDRWTSHFDWAGAGPMPQVERDKLHQIVEEAHANGQRVRFWATPDDPGVREPVWNELVAAGVDYINTDDLSGLRYWLLDNDPAPASPEVDWFDRFDGLFEWFAWLGWAR